MTYIYIWRFAPHTLSPSSVYRLALSLNATNRSNQFWLDLQQQCTFIMNSWTLWSRVFVLCWCCLCWGLSMFECYRPNIVLIKEWNILWTPTENSYLDLDTWNCPVTACVDGTSIVDSRCVVVTILDSKHRHDSLRPTSHSQREYLFRKSGFVMF